MTRYHVERREPKGGWRIFVQNGFPCVYNTRKRAIFVCDYVQEWFVEYAFRVSVWHYDGTQYKSKGQPKRAA